MLWLVIAVVPNETHKRIHSLFFSFILSTSLSLPTQKAHFLNLLSLRELHSSNFKASFFNGVLQSYYFLMDPHSLYFSSHPSNLLCEYPYLHFFVFFFSSLIVLYLLLIQCLFCFCFLSFRWLRCVRLGDSKFGVVLINPWRYTVWILGFKY